MKINVLFLKKTKFKPFTIAEYSCSLSVSEGIHSKIKCANLYTSSVFYTVVLTQTRHRTIRLYGI